MNLLSSTEILAPLREFVKSGDEGALEQAYLLGRSALSSGLGLADMVLLHRNAVEEIAAEQSGTDRILLEGRATLFLAEMLAPFEMARRGFEEANASLQVLNDSLEKRVQEGTEKLWEAHEIMRQTQKLDSLGRLAGGIAHDYNNILVVILMSVNAALMTAPEDDVQLREDLTDIKDAAERAVDLTRHLLSFSRQGTVRPQVLNANQLVLDLGKMLRRLLKKHIEIVTETCAQAATVFMDRTQLEQILVNLAVNARDVMPTGGRLTVSVEVRSIESSKAEVIGASTCNFVLLRVADTGPGIPEDIKDTIFEPFVTTKAEDQGTGLGLSIVHGIVTKANGFIEVNSSPQGTEFLIHLPLYDDTDD